MLKGQKPIVHFLPRKLVTVSCAVVLEWSVFLLDIVTPVDETPACCQSLLPTSVTRVSVEGQSSVTEWPGLSVWLIGQADGPRGLLLLAFHVKPDTVEQMEGKGPP